MNNPRIFNRRKYKESKRIDFSQVLASFSEKTVSIANENRAKSSHLQSFENMLILSIAQYSFFGGLSKIIVDCGKKGGGGDLSRRGREFPLTIPS